MRFIEHMPLDGDPMWQREAMVTVEEILAAVSTWLSLGADDALLADAMIACVARKLPGHGIDDPSFVQPMSAIGG